MTYLFIFSKFFNLDKIYSHIYLISSWSKCLLNIVLSIVLNVMTNKFLTRIISVLEISISNSLMYLFLMDFFRDAYYWPILEYISSKRLFFMNYISLQVPRISFKSFHLYIDLWVISVMCLKTVLKRVRYSSRIFSWTGISLNS